MFTFNRHRLLSIAGLFASACLSMPAGAASVNASVGFTFADGVATDLVAAGNRIRFSDNSELGLSISASAWVGGDWNNISASTVVAADADYEAYGYSVANGVSGLGVCDNGKKFGRCLGNADTFGLNAQNSASTEWLLLTSDDVMKFDSLLLEPTNNKKGSLVVYAGTIDPTNPLSGFNAENFASLMTFDYAARSANQQVDLTNFRAGNALLIGAQGGQTAFAVRGMKATVVPIPSAVWLLGSAMLLLTVRARRRSD